MWTYLYLSYDCQNSFPGGLVITKYVIHKQVAKDLKYPRQITAIRTQNKRIVSVELRKTQGLQYLVHVLLL